MENSLEFYKNWIFDSAKDKKMLINQLSWPSRCGIEIKDYAVQFEVNGKKFVGHGSDIDSDLAILKAVSEAFERYCVTLLQLNNSNGCAVHLSIEEAKKKALLELVERDCFLVRFIKGMPFEKIDDDFRTINLDKKHRLTSYCLASGLFKVILTRIEIDQSANILGLGAELNFKDALMKSQVEALRQLMYVSDKNLASTVSYEVISKKNQFSFDDHGDIALTPEHYSEIDFIFKQENSQSFRDFKYFDPMATVFKEYEIFLEKTNPFFGIPLLFVKASNPNAQELFVGKTTENLNPLRILNTGKLNLCLHPFR